ncbi:hypothetical protein MTR67_036479 [Solanum verrucosum]|uniref:F-box domain-containing protein n=1 Tax=Solanum verrucosum TaxID=315347 RepID=A0AAF0UCL3_SOLVR|nr:hypothetical protein MTR67_036479 [Solanum verrucosum]
MNKKSGESSGADRISSLPRDILQKILGCLPLHDAVRTSVLSTKWSEFDSFIIEAPNLRIFKFSSTANSLCFRRIPLLEEIVLGMPFNKSESFTVPEPQLTLDNIKILNFKNLIFSQSYAFTSCACACTRPMQSQEMTMTHSAMKQLKSVDMTLMWVNKTEMEFLKHVLAYATALEKIYIATSAEIRHRGMKMMEEMKRFPRASPNVEFIYHS